MKRSLFMMNLLARLLTYESCRNWIEWRKDWIGNGKRFDE